MPNSSEQPRFDSISHFLQSGSFDYRVFDMGRKVTLISVDEFKKIETQQQLYPYPFQKKASLALLFWPKVKDADKKEPVIWFLQFPIDEMGYLQLESRDGFLLSLLEQAGKNIQSKQKGSVSTDEMTESPFAFKPSEERLAMFHAFATRELAEKPSHYYKPTQEYLKGSLGYDQWQFLGLQGIADVVARLDESNNEALLEKALSKLPDIPLESFVLLLENRYLSPNLTSLLIALFEEEVKLESPNIKLVSAQLRALTGGKPDKLRKAFLLKLMTSSAFSSTSRDINILAVVSGRAWEDLEDSLLLLPFMENLATNNQIAFDAVLKDLMLMPLMKQKVLDIISGGKCTKALVDKFDGLIKAV